MQVERPIMRTSDRRRASALSIALALSMGQSEALTAMTRYTNIHPHLLLSAYRGAGCRSEAYPVRHTRVRATRMSSEPQQQDISDIASSAQQSTAHSASSTAQKLTGDAQDVAGVAVDSKAQHAGSQAVNSAASTAKIMKEHNEIWDSRRSMVRGVLTLADNVAKARSKYMSAEEKEADAAVVSAEHAKNAFLITAFTVAAGAATIRVGGRAALMSVLGLDVVQNSGVTDQISGGLEFITSQPDTIKYALFGLGWMVSKTLCLDFLSVFLALGR